MEWTRDHWGGGLALRYVHDMVQTSGNTLSSRFFTDVQVRYTSPRYSSFTAVLGINNLLDQDPATCDSCGVIGMSPVVHDLPGTIGFVRLVWDIPAG